MKRYFHKLIFIFALFLAFFAFLKLNFIENQSLDQKNTLNRSIKAQPRSLDPLYGYLSYEFEFMQDIYSGLVVSGPNGNAQAGLISHWEMSEDQKTYHFYLRDDIYFSNGEHITVEDIIFSFQRAIDPDSAVLSYVDLYFPIKNAKAIYKKQITDLSQLGIYAPNPKEVVIELEHPKPFFIEDLKHSIFYVVSKKAVQTYGKKWTEPENIVTSGPYKLKQWKKDDYIALEKNPYFFEVDQVAIQNVTYHFISDENSALRFFKTDEIDMTGQIPFNKIDILKQTHAGQLHFNPVYINYFYAFNLENKALQDKRVRQALSLVIDREALAKNVLKNSYMPLYSVVPDLMDNYTVQPLSHHKLPIAERIRKAQMLMQNAGYTSQKKLTFTIHYNHSEIHETIAVALENMLEKHLDVDVKLESADMSTHYQKMYNNGYDLGRASFTGRYADPYDFLNYFHSTIHFNFSSYKNEEVDQLLEQAYIEANLETRRALLETVERQVLDEFVILPLFTHGRYYLLNEKVKGFTLNPTDNFPSRYLRLE